MSAQPSTQYYHHGRFRVAGGVLPDAVTAYRTYGEPKNPCIVFPTCYGGKLDSAFTLKNVSSFWGWTHQPVISFSGQLYMVGDGKVYAS